MSPKILHIYQKEYEKQTQEKADMIDYESWLIGLYVMKAVGACLNNKNKYPETQLRIQKNKSEETGEIAAIRFAEFSKSFNKGFNKKAGEISGG